MSDMYSFVFTGSWHQRVKSQKEAAVESSICHRWSVLQSHIFCCNQQVSLALLTYCTVWTRNVILLSSCSLDHGKFNTAEKSNWWFIIKNSGLSTKPTNVNQEITRYLANMLVYFNRTWYGWKCALKDVGHLETSLPGGQQLVQSAHTLWTADPQVLWFFRAQLNWNVSTTAVAGTIIVARSYFSTAIMPPENGSRFQRSQF